jgi:hypothetical protein
MKEIKLFEEWAERTIANEKAAPEKKERPLPRDMDLQYQASRKYPDRTPDQAMQLYIADKFSDNEEVDSQQNVSIQSQRRENTRLKKTVQALSQELAAHEEEAQRTEQEVQRLKDLSTRLRSSNDQYAQAAKLPASAGVTESREGESILKMDHYIKLLK